MRRLTKTIILAIALLLSGTVVASTALSYQGRLDAGGQAFDGSVDMVFELFDAEAGGTAVGSPIAINGVAVQQGLFQVELDFGAQAWEMGRWLQITVEGQPLTPRQKVTGAPLAWRAETVVEEAVGSQELEDGGVQGLDIADDSIFSNHVVDGSINSQDIAVGAVTSVNIADGTITPVDVAGGLYSNKSDLYVGEATKLIDAPGLVSATARCSDNNDIPISWDCETGALDSPLSHKGVRNRFWTDPAAPAETQCMARYGSVGVGTVTLITRIYCIAVP